MLNWLVMNFDRDAGLELELRFTTLCQRTAAFPLELQLLASADEFMVLVHATAGIHARFRVRHQIIFHVMRSTRCYMRLKQAFFASAWV